VVHEADLRGALAAGRVPLEDVLTALRLYVSRWGREVLGPAGLHLEVEVTDAGTWAPGAEGGPVAGRVGVSSYELFRALAGRRSAAQVGAWDWSVDPEPWVAAGLPYPFQWAAEDLID
jgi:hypothetical protein